jgi:hypothetical protein
MRLGSLVMAKTLRCSALHGLIYSIGLVRTKEEMLISNAWWIVTAVTNDEALWDRPMLHFPSNPMCHNGAVADANLTVTSGEFCRCPNPTVSKIWTVFRDGAVPVYLFPEAFGQGTIRGHHEPPIHGVVRQDVHSIAAAYHCIISVEC